MGIEATVIGVPVIAAGRSRYDTEGFVHMPAPRQEFREMVGKFLDHGAHPVTEDMVARARRCLYFTTYRTSLDVSGFLEAVNQFAYTPRSDDAMLFHPDRSLEMKIVRDGIVDGAPFHYPETDPFTV